jgi:tetratricopeptide (TPR) repeat protein
LARRALQDSLPEVAVDQLSKLRDTGRLDEQGGLLLIEALVRSGQTDEALQYLDEHLDGSNAKMTFWRAAALAGSGRFEEAIVEFHAVVTMGPGTPHWEEACLSGASLMLSMKRDQEAQILLENLAGNGNALGRSVASLRLAEYSLALGDHAAALEWLGPPDSDWDAMEAAAAIIRARCLLKAEQPAAASMTLAPLLAVDKGLSRLEFVLVRLTAADSLAQENKAEEATRILVALIDAYPEAPFLDRAFDRLAAMGAFVEPSVLDYLQSWSDDDEVERALLARFSRAVALKQADRMTEALAAFVEVVATEASARSLARRALLEMAEIHAVNSETDKARECLQSAETESIFLPELQARINYILGLIQWGEEDFEGAATAFSEMKGNPQDTLVAAINSALAAIRADNEEMLSNALTLIGQSEASVDLHAQIRIEEALVAASEHRPKAQSLLKAVIDHFPDHPRLPEIELVLAETFLLSMPAFPRAAEHHLDRAAALGLQSDALRERADYVRVYIAESGFDDAGVIHHAGYFLKKWPGGDLALRVRMKLAEVYDRNHDYPNAQTQFEILAEELGGDDAMKETALFFAGRASMALFNPTGLGQAVETFGRVVELNGGLAPIARLYQAKAKRRSGMDGEALPILDDLIEKETNSAIRLQAMVEKIEALITLGESGEEESFEKAEQVAQFLNSEFTDSRSRFRVAFLRMKIKERLGDIQAAVAIGYEAITIGASEPQNIIDPGVLGWLYRLGFNTANLLERLGRHEAAVHVVEQLAGTTGDRATEARELAEQIRLRHFIWDQ